jgi:hypothetical protein
MNADDTDQKKPYRRLTRMIADKETTKDTKGRIIAVIAEIARHRRNRKSTSLPLMNADKRGSGNC